MNYEVTKFLRYIKHFVEIIKRDHILSYEKPSKLEWYWSSIRDISSRSVINLANGNQMMINTEQKFFMNETKNKRRWIKTQAHQH